MGKRSGTEILEGVASAINGELHPFPVAWPHRYGTIEPSPGARIFVEIAADLTLAEVPPSHLVHRVVSWMRLQGNPDWFLTTKRAAEAVEMFRCISVPIPLASIRPVRWLTEGGYTWHRLPWDLREGSTPTWDRLLSRLSNAEAFRAFCGSLFFDDAKQHQYLWIYGMGADGKGAINRFIEKLFGPSYRIKQPPAPGDKFWTYGLIGARAVVFPDCNAKAFVASGLFKSITGGDAVDVEAKGQMSFTTRLFARFIFLSNNRPTLSSQKSDLRRIIYCEFENEAPEETGFEDLLWEEGGAFVTQCVKEYLRLCPTHTSIPTSDEAIKDWLSVVEEEFETIFTNHFVRPNNELYRTSAGVQGLTLEQLNLVTVQPSHLQYILDTKTNLDKRQQAEFRDWMKKKYGIDKRSVNVAAPVQVVDGKLISIDGNGPTKRYVGLAVRNIKLVSTPSTYPR